MGVPVAPSSPGPKRFQDFRKKARGPYLYPDELTNQQRAEICNKEDKKKKQQQNKGKNIKKKDKGNIYGTDVGL